MKKLFALFVMVVVTLSGFCASAQTTSFGINTFCQPLTKSGPNNWSNPNSVYKKLMDMKSENAINSSLLKAGFSCYSKKKLTEFDDGLGEYVTYILAKYYKAVKGGNIYVNQEGCNITITFPNASEKNKFLQTVKSVKEKGYIFTSTNYYWIGVRIESEGMIVRVGGCGAN